MIGGGESAWRSMPRRSMSSMRRAGLHERSSMSRKNLSPVMIVAWQASLRTSRGHCVPPKRAAQSSQPSGTRCVWRSIRTLLVLDLADALHDLGQRVRVLVPPCLELVGILVGDRRLCLLHGRFELGVLHGLAHG